MKVSELIKSLQYCEEQYGDLDVQIDLNDNPEVLKEDKIFVNYHQTEEKDTIQIQNYPY